MSARRAVLLVGSARPRGESTSEALGRYLLARMESSGWGSEIFFVSHVRGPDELSDLTSAIGGADLFVLATPLYVDALPHLVTAALEHIAAARAAEPRATPCRFVAIVNCGFPEVVHTAVALDICRSFARQARLECVGALGLGGGETVHGRGLERLGWVTRHVRHALDLAALALTSFRPVPDKAVQLMGRSMLPVRAYTLAADALLWRREARKQGVEKYLEARPYANE